MLQLEVNSKAVKIKAWYNSANYLFVSWLYDKREVYPGIIKAECLPIFDAAYGMDLHERTSKKR